MADAVALADAVGAVARAAPAPPRPPAAACAPLDISVISNSRLLRDGVTSLLGDHLSCRLVGSYAGEDRSDADLPNPAGHVVLLDNNIGRAAALRWLGHWRARTPVASVLVLDLADDADKIIEYIEHGASGYTLESASVAEVAAAVARLRGGEASCSPAITAHMFARLAHLRAAVRALSADAALTAREMEVLRDLAANMSNRQIAEHLVIEVRTVKHHVHNILEKLNQPHRWDAVRYAREQGWLGEL